jgi:hypothetical protein
MTDKEWAEAKRKRWAFGREKYGPEWAGKPPLWEALDELVDCSNYLEEAVRQGDLNGLDGKQISHDIRSLAMLVEYKAIWGPGEGEG